METRTRKTWVIPSVILADCLSIGPGPRPVRPGTGKPPRSDPDGVLVAPSMSDVAGFPPFSGGHGPAGRWDAPNPITDTEIRDLMWDGLTPDGATPAGATRGNPTADRPRTPTGPMTAILPAPGGAGNQTAEMPRYVDVPLRDQPITSNPITRTGFLPVDQDRPRPLPVPVPNTPRPFPVPRPAPEQRTEVMPSVAAGGSYGLAAWMDRD